MLINGNAYSRKWKFVQQDILQSLQQRAVTVANEMETACSSGFYAGCLGAGPAKSMRILFGAAGLATVQDPCAPLPTPTAANLTGGRNPGVKPGDAQSCSAGCR